MPKQHRDKSEDDIVEELLLIVGNAVSELGYRDGRRITSGTSVTVKIPGSEYPDHRTTGEGLYKDLLVSFVAARGPRVIGEFREFVDDFLDENKEDPAKRVARGATPRLGHIQRKGTR